MPVEIPFALVADIEARWRALSDEEATRALVLIEDASQLIVDECPNAVNASALTLQRIVCAMVKRAMISGDAAPGISTSQETAGPFSQSFNYTNPMGDLYLTKTERKSLPCGRGRAYMIDTTPPVEEAAPWWTL